MVCAVLCGLAAAELLQFAEDGLVPLERAPLQRGHQGGQDSCHPVSNVTSDLEQGADEEGATVTTASPGADDLCTHSTHQLSTKPCETDRMTPMTPPKCPDQKGGLISGVGWSGLNTGVQVHCAETLMTPD